MKISNKKCNLGCAWQFGGECFIPADRECGRPGTPKKDSITATKSYENGVTLTAEKFENWNISDDLHMETSPFKVVAERMANGYDRYIAEQLIKLNIDPDVLVHQQREINRLKSHIKSLEMDKEQLEFDVENALCNLGNVEAMYGDALKQLETLAEAGVVQVVRCKYCRYWDDRRDGTGLCEHPVNGITRDYTTANDYCSYGE